MIRNIKKKHGLIYLGILLVFSFIFVSRCIETSSKPVPSVSTAQFSETQLYSNLASDSVISRREALFYIKSKKLKKFIPQLKKLISEQLTSEDRRLAAETLGSVSDINNINNIFSLISSSEAKEIRPYYLKSVITYLLENPSPSSFLDKMASRMQIIIDVLTKDDSIPNKKDALKIIRFLKYNNAFDAVFKLTSVVEIRPDAITTLASITSERQKPQVILVLKKMLSDEANNIIRRYIKLSIASLEKPELSANPEIISLLSDAGSKSIITRDAAYKKLSILAPSALSPYLLYSLGDEEKRVRMACIKLIAKLKLAGFEEKLDANISQMLSFLRGHNEYELASDCAKASIFALAEIKTSKAFDVIKKHLFNYRIKDAAYIALASFDSVDAINLLNNVINSESEDIKSLVADALYKNGKFDIFMKNIKSPNEYTRLLSVKYLSMMSSQNVTALLTEALKNEHSPKWKEIYQMALDKAL